jgi:hypothetical protein
MSSGVVRCRTDGPCGSSIDGSLGAPRLWVIARAGSSLWRLRARPEIHARRCGSLGVETPAPRRGHSHLRDRPRVPSLLPTGEPDGTKCALLLRGTGMRRPGHRVACRPSRPSRASRRTSRACRSPRCLPRVAGARHGYGAGSPPSRQASGEAECAELAHGASGQVCVKAGELQRSP